MFQAQHVRCICVAESLLQFVSMLLALQDFFSTHEADAAVLKHDKALAAQPQRSRHLRHVPAYLRGGAAADGVRDGHGGGGGHRRGGGAWKRHKHGARADPLKARPCACLLACAGMLYPVAHLSSRVLADRCKLLAYRVDKHASCKRCGNGPVPLLPCPVVVPATGWAFFFYETVRCIELFSGNVYCILLYHYLHMSIR